MTLMWLLKVGLPSIAFGSCDPRATAKPASIAACGQCTQASTLARVVKSAFEASSKASCRLQSFLPSPELRACCLRSLTTSSRPSDLLQALRPRPEPPASRVSCRLHSLQSPPDPSASFRLFDLLQALRSLPDPSIPSRAFDLLQF
jgi:hypothetical protein